jgi:hypothetical protein
MDAFSSFNRLSLFLGPLHRERARLESPTVEQFLVLKELGFDPMRAVVAQLTQDGIVPAQKVEQTLDGSGLPAAVSASGSARSRRKQKGGASFNRITQTTGLLFRQDPCEARGLPQQLLGGPAQFRRLVPKVVAVHGQCGHVAFDGLARLFHRFPPSVSLPYVSASELFDIA